MTPVMAPDAAPGHARPVRGILSDATERPYAGCLRAAVAVAAIAVTMPACSAADAPSTAAPHLDPPRDAGDAGDDAPAGAGSFGYDGAGVDAFVTWCDAGPPRVVSVGSCEVVVEVPCGIPVSDPPAQGGLLPRVDCLRICPTDGGFSTYDQCHLDTSEAGAASGGVLVDCIPDCT